MARAFLFVLDSVGIGGAPDAESYGDTGSNTIGHIAEKCANGEGDRDGIRQGLLKLPNLERLGLGYATESASGTKPEGLNRTAPAEGHWGHAKELSKGKDTPSGHWEIAGVPVPFDWGYFPHEIPCFPKELTDALLAEAELPGILGNRHASGTEIIAELGIEHITSGKPICYTSADSVFQIAAHEEYFGLDRLYHVCEVARKLVDPYNIGRVIARPFIGKTPDTFERTGNRRDLAVPPPSPTLLDRIEGDGSEVFAIGKIADIYAHQGVTDIRKANGNEDLFETTLRTMDDAANGDLVFTNFVDFDQLYGHRRDVPGYAAALEYFDKRLPEIEAKLKSGDLAIITADHGCDPTWQGNDHTREQVPVLAFGPDINGGKLGQLDTFADIGETIAAHLGIPEGEPGRNFL